MPCGAIEPRGVKLVVIPALIDDVELVAQDSHARVVIGHGIDAAGLAADARISMPRSAVEPRGIKVVVVPTLVNRVEPAFVSGNVGAVVGFRVDAARLAADARISIPRGAVEPRGEKHVAVPSLVDDVKLVVQDRRARVVVGHGGNAAQLDADRYVAVPRGAVERRGVKLVVISSLVNLHQILHEAIPFQLKCERPTSSAPPSWVVTAHR